MLWWRRVLGLSIGCARRFQDPRRQSRRHRRVRLDQPDRTESRHPSHPINQLARWRRSPTIVVRRKSEFWGREAWENKHEDLWVRITSFASSRSTMLGRFLSQITTLHFDVGFKGKLRGIHWLSLLFLVAHHSLPPTFPSRGTIIPFSLSILLYTEALQIAPADK